jgi:hypothetical protein
MGREAAALGCADFITGFSGTDAACTINGPTAKVTGPFTLGDLTITSTGVLNVAPGGITITLSKTIFPASQGSLLMLAGSEINGDVGTAIPGAPITINATGDILLKSDPAGTLSGAIIHSNAVKTSCAGSNRGGKITLNADTDQDQVGSFIMEAGTTTDNGSKVQSIASCGLGEIIITGSTISIDGDVLSQGISTKGRGGPITVNAACSLTITSKGSVVSIGTNPGADLVHLQGGCDVKIFGLVASTGPGHAGGFNRCQPPNRPGHPTASQACVEIWAGDSLTIDSTAGNNGEISADTAFAGGVQGTGWIDLFSRGPINIIGDIAKPFAAHANQGLNNGRGGTVTVKSKAAAVVISGLGLQASDPSSGGSGGLIIIDAQLKVDLTAGTNEARGATSGGGAQNGGKIFVHAFGTGPAGTGPIDGSSTSLLDVTGRTPPDGVVNLTACDTFDGFGPGQIAPPGLPAGNIIKTVSCVANASPDIPGYVTLPPCLCPGGCPCVASFKCVPGKDPNTSTLTLTGTGLTGVTAVELHAGCFNPVAAFSTTSFVKTQTLITVTVPAPPTPPAGSYNIITTDATGFCCTKNTITIPCQ